ARQRFGAPHARPREPRYGRAPAARCGRRGRPPPRLAEARRRGAATQQRTDAVAPGSRSWLASPPTSRSGPGASDLLQVDEERLELGSARVAVADVGCQRDGEPVAAERLI